MGFIVSRLNAFIKNTDKTIELTLNKGNTEPSKYKRTFAILGGADANKFTLAGNQLTTKIYRVLSS
jgi:hypothetical protein